MGVCLGPNHCLLSNFSTTTATRRYKLAGETITPTPLLAKLFQENTRTTIFEVGQYPNH